jgi:hypothetical protein
MVALLLHSMRNILAVYYPGRNVPGNIKNKNEKAILELSN